MHGKTFPFIREFTLTAYRNPRGKKQLILAYVKNGKTIDSTKILCIHTKLLDIPAENLGTAKQDPDEFAVQAQNSGEHTEIKLSKDDDMQAFVSWVQGIAESGIDAFFIQSEFENASGHAYSITVPMMKFISKYNDEIFQMYLDRIQRECKFDGTWHEASLRANMMNIIYSVYFMKDKERKKRYLAYLVDSSIPTKYLDPNIINNSYLFDKELYEFKNTKIFNETLAFVTRAYDEKREKYTRSEKLKNAFPFIPILIVCVILYTIYLTESLTTMAVITIMCAYVAVTIMMLISMRADPLNPIMIYTVLNNKLDNPRLLTKYVYRISAGMTDVAMNEYHREVQYIHYTTHTGTWLKKRLQDYMILFISNVKYIGNSKKLKLFYGKQIRMKDVNDVFNNFFETKGENFCLDTIKISAEEDIHPNVIFFI